MTVTRRLLSLLALVVLAALLATACAAAPTPTSVPTAAPTKAAFPVTVKDANGADFTLSASPQKIVALPIWAAEMVYGLVDVSRVTAVSKWSDDPNLSPAVATTKLVPNRVESKSPEGIIALKPDLVILDTFSDADGSLTKTLTDAGIPVLVLASPVTLDDVKSTILILAAATGETANGQAMVSAIDDKLKSVSDKIATLTASQRLSVMYYYPDYTNAGMLSSYNDATPFGAIAAAAGLTNVCDAPKYSAVSKEKVVKDWKPQVFVTSSLTYLPDFSTVDDGGVAAKASILADATLKDVPAVQNGMILSIPDKYMQSTSQYMADAVVLLAKAAYPDLFK